MAEICWPYWRYVFNLSSTIENGLNIWAKHLGFHCFHRGAVPTRTTALPGPAVWWTTSVWRSGDPRAATWCIPASAIPRKNAGLMGWDGWVGMDKWKMIYIYTKYIERMMNDGCGCKSWVKSEDFRFSSSSWAVESCRFHVVVQLRWLQMMICAGVELQQWELLDYQPVRG